MKIERRGSQKNHGYRSVLHPEDDVYEWNVNECEFISRRENVSSDGTTSQHNYRMSITLDEVGHLIDLLAKEVYEKSGEDIFQLLKGRVANLQLLSMCALGYPPPNQLWEGQVQFD